MRLGIVPAVISPYVIRRIGLTKAREWMLTAEKFTGADAFRSGLVNRLVMQEHSEAVLAEIAEGITELGPKALESTKRLLSELEFLKNESEVLNLTIQSISTARKSKEGQEGMHAFLEKRKPLWQN